MQTTYLEDELGKMSEKLKCAQRDLEKSREDACNSDAINNQYKLEVTKLSTRCKEYGKVIVDVHHNIEAIART